MSKIIHPFLAASLVALSLVLTACSSGTVQTASASSSAPKIPAKPAPAPADVSTNAADNLPKSVFTLDQTSRDPFYPKATIVKQEATTSTPEIALDVPAILQANLHGIISSGGKSIAYVSNVMLEAGRKAVIPIRAGGQERQVTVQCREVTKETVVLEVQGYTEPVRLTKAIH